MAKYNRKSPDEIGEEELLLPVPYFLFTFTLSEGLREVARSNQKVVYGLLLRASAMATQQVAQDARLVGDALGGKPMQLVSTLQPSSRCSPSADHT